MRTTGAPLRVLVLGAGFGGLEVSSRLSAALGDDVHITLIDQSDAFVFGFSKLDVMFGRHTFDEVRLPYRDVARSNLEFRQESVRSIDAERKRVVTSGGTYDADIVIVALGADLAPEATPGLVEGGHEFYSPEAAARLTQVLRDFRGGNVVIGVLGGFFKCPPAPYETAFMLHDFLTRTNLRAASRISIVTPMPKPIPISAEVSTAIIDLLDERDIGHSHATWITSVDAADGTLQIKGGGTMPYDLFLAIPVHVAPPVVVDSGLTDDGWIAVDPATLVTKWPDVYAVGDITSAPVPRAGVIAEGEAATVAAVILHELRGGDPPPPFAGAITCYVEMGDDTVGKADVNFLSGPAPTAAYTPPSLAVAEEKSEFAATRRARWFGANNH